MRQERSRATSVPLAQAASISYSHIINSYASPQKRHVLAVACNALNAIKSHPRVFLAEAFAAARFVRLQGSSAPRQRMECTVSFYRLPSAMALDGANGVKKTLPLSQFSCMRAEYAAKFLTPINERPCP